jgi:hypothetical protein
VIRAGLVLCAAADKLNAERVTFPPSEDDAGTWAEAVLMVDGETVHVRVEVTS